MNRASLAVGLTHTVEDAIRRHVKYSLGKAWREISPADLFTAVAVSIRDRLVEGMLQTEERYRRDDSKRLSYLSIEYLIGQSLGSYLDNLGLREPYRCALQDLGYSLDAMEAMEGDAPLGNGGLGRLAACFLDSLATLGMCACGYGINYEYGLFRQEIDDGYQREKPESWMTEDTPWQIARPQDACLVPIYGRVEHDVDRKGGYNPLWMDWTVLMGVPHDMLIAGYGGHTVNLLRLYSARASHDFDIRIFNDGDYFRAVERKIASENISKVLYPVDSAIGGRELRLVQEYFLVACAVRDTVRRFLARHSDLRQFPSKVAIQLNDTHPALAVVELMRILVDERELAWDQAWEITRASLAYTNHTLAAEALEKWPVPLLEHVLPRHLQLIYEINRRFLEQAAVVCGGNGEVLERLSLLEESTPKHVRMANLAMVGCHSINGVSEIHSGLIKTSLAPDFYALWRERFNNKTNGITQRRWLLKANPPLANLISEVIGRGWITDLEQLQALKCHLEDNAFRDGFRKVKRRNKEKLIDLIHDTLRIRTDPASLFDVQIKRIHAYKRQLLNVMHIMDEYLALIEDGKQPVVPRTYIFSGKAAPGYWLAKQYIKLIHNVARVINADARAKGWMRVVFLPDYRVSLAEKIIPAADLSEQISTAGLEASGTSNMKMALNGAVTIGTLDGANIEILQEVGAANMFIFGLTAAAIQEIRARGSYRPKELYERDPQVRRVLDAFRSGLFCRQEPDLFSWIVGMILDDNDPYFHVADLPAYLTAQREAGESFVDGDRWARMAIQNVANMGKFSSDRTVAQYARDIWNIDRYRPE